MAGLKSTNWMGYTKKRCTNHKCKQRIRSYPELGICNNCVNKLNDVGKKKRKFLR